MADKLSRELLAYAFVAQEYAVSGSALDGVALLLAHIVSARAGKNFDPAEVATEAKNSLGLDLSPLVVESLVPSLLKKGVLETVASAAGHAAYRCRAVEAQSYIVAEQEVDATLSRFREFARSLLAEHGLSASDAELDDSLLSFLVTADFLSSWLQADMSEFRGNVLGLRRVAEQVNGDNRLTRAVGTACALFVQDVFEKDQKLFEKLTEMSWGAVIVEVVTALQVGASGSNSSLEDLVVYVDTPILLDLLDLGEVAQHKYAQDLFDLLRKSKATIATFTHVVEEMKSAVETTLSRFIRGEPFSGPMANRLRADPGYRLFARQTISQLERKLEELGVEIHVDAEFETPDLARHFSEANVDSLRSRVGVLHKNVERRDRDAKSIAYVVRARAGLTVSPVSLSRYVFVTRNAGLCKVSADYVASSGTVAAGTAPPCVTDRQLAGVLWFCSGSTEPNGASLTKQKIIANCASAVAPRLDVVTRMGQVLFDKDKERLLEYEALMRDQRAALCLTKETLNVSSLVDADQATELLERMREELTAEAREQAERDRNELVAKLELERREAVAYAEREAASARQESEDRDSALKAAEARLRDRDSDAAEKSSELSRVHQAIAELRVDVDSRKASESQTRSELESLRDQVLGLESVNVRSRQAVRASLKGELRTIGLIWICALVVVYGVLCAALQRFSDPLDWRWSAGAFIVGVAGFWMIPALGARWLFSRLLMRSARTRLGIIKSTSGLEFDADEVVSEVLSALRLSR